MTPERIKYVASMWICGEGYFPQLEKDRGAPYIFTDGDMLCYNNNSKGVTDWTVIGITDPDNGNKYLAGLSVFGFVNFLFSLSRMLKIIGSSPRVQILSKEDFRSFHEKFYKTNLPTLTTTGTFACNPRFETATSIP